MYHCPRSPSKSQSETDERRDTQGEAVFDSYAPELKSFLFVSIRDGLQPTSNGLHPMSDGTMKYSFKCANGSLTSFLP